MSLSITQKNNTKSLKMKDLNVCIARPCSGRNGHETGHSTIAIRDNWAYRCTTSMELSTCNIKR